MAEQFVGKASEMQDGDRRIITLSGGVDSRALLFYLHKRRGLETITWGISDARGEDGNDALIARTVADVFGVGNRFFPVDLSSVTRETLIQRFLVAGEGRVARKDFTHMIVELLLGGALRREES